MCAERSTRKFITYGNEADTKTDDQPANVTRSAAVNSEQREPNHPGVCAGAPPAGSRRRPALNDPTTRQPDNAPLHDHKAHRRIHGSRLGTSHHPLNR